MARVEIDNETAALTQTNLKSALKELDKAYKGQRTGIDMKNNQTAIGHLIKLVQTTNEVQRTDLVAMRGYAEDKSEFRKLLAAHQGLGQVVTKKLAAGKKG